MTSKSELTAGAIEAIVGGYHGDPFAVLGPHQTAKGQVAIRAFMPHVERLFVHVEGAEPVEMGRIHPVGFFEATLKGVRWPLTYRYRWMLHDQSEGLCEDPYRFPPMLSAYDEYLLAEGTHARIYEHLGAHLAAVDGVHGVRFAVWAPSAQRVSVIGDFNYWDGRRHPMRRHVNSGIWELFVPDVAAGALYKFEIKTPYHGLTVAKSDPVGFYSEVRPNTASIVCDIDEYEWSDEQWLQRRAENDLYAAPVSIYEVHLGSWRRKDSGEWLSYKELAEQLIPYVKQLGFTHIELMPIAEHPFDGSWGYQIAGFFAPTSRFGAPDEFMAFVDACHRQGIGVILDWVPAHFPKDEHGLGFFDGTHLYEHADPRQGQHPDWGTYIFNYGRNEVCQFLVSNALFWLDKYHIDGLRVDAVASMLYLDFSREEGQWLPNRYGGRENLEAIDFLRIFNDRVHEQFPGVVTFAEESTAWAGVTSATAQGGLGFDFKWNMGWMHDSLRYMSSDPVYRSFHHGTLTFSLLYAFSERFVLPFSHDEVVHLKRSMLDKMPGDVWQKFANARALYAYQFAHPGKKLLFMGAEIGQWREWSEERELDWALLEQDDKHQGLQDLITDLNVLYQQQPALFSQDFTWHGFSWLDFHDSANSVIAFARHGADGGLVLTVCNFTPIVRRDYRVPAPTAGAYVETLNTDDAKYGGSGVVNSEPVLSSPTPWRAHEHSIAITLPPLAVIYLTPLASDEAAS